MDVVYVVKPAEHNQELRYSLRSLANVPHDRVWIAGHCPKWASSDVGRISVAPGVDKYRSSTANLHAAAAHPEVADDFYLFNDDFFVMEPMDAVPMMHRGPIEKVAEYHAGKGSTVYLRGMRDTERFMRDKLGLDDILSYELHVPMPLEKARALEALALPIRHRNPIQPLHKRTLYGNYFGVGGEQIADCKVFGSTQAFKDLPLLSTADNAFHHQPVGRYIRAKFPDPSPYERTP